MQNAEKHNAGYFYLQGKGKAQIEKEPARHNFQERQYYSKLKETQH